MTPCSAFRREVQQVPQAEPLCPDVMTPHTDAAYILYQNGNAGMNPKALQYIMGHANIVMTLNYYA